MGRTYGEAWIELLYDLDTEVKEIVPPEDLKRHYSGLNAKKYLVLFGTDRIFPQ